VRAARRKVGSPMQARLSHHAFDVPQVPKVLTGPEKTGTVPFNADPWLSNALSACDAMCVGIAQAATYGAWGVASESSASRS